MRLIHGDSDVFRVLESRDEMEIRRGSSIGARRVVLSSNLWRSSFGRDSSIVGSAVQLIGEPFEVVGIAPEGRAHRAKGRDPGRLGQAPP